MACQCHSEYVAITAQLARIANAMEASNAAAPDLILTNALVQAIVTDSEVFSGVQGCSNTMKMPVGTAVKELVDRLKAGYNA